MKMKCYALVILLFASMLSVSAQFGIKMGVNTANEIRTFTDNAVSSSFQSRNLSGLQLGLVYQKMPQKSGFGVETGILFSQKGSSFTDSATVSGVIVNGYRELSYVDIPLNLRYRLKLGFVGIYATAGLYGSYELSGKTISQDTDPNVTITSVYDALTDRLDYGYTYGVGAELFNKLQVGLSWMSGLKNQLKNVSGLPAMNRNQNNVFTVSLMIVL